MNAWGALVVIAIAGATFQGVGEKALHALRYERDALLDGDLWRAVSGHFVHESWKHLGVDVAVGALVAAALGRHLGLGALVLCVAGTTAGLFLFALRVKTYAGLAGVLHGLIAYGVLEAWRRDRRRIWLVAAILLGVKVAVEKWKGESGGLAHMLGVPVCIDAHLWGAVAGAVAFVLLYRPARP